MRLEHYGAFLDSTLFYPLLRFTSAMLCVGETSQEPVMFEWYIQIFLLLLYIVFRKHCTFFVTLVCCHDKH